MFIRHILKSVFSVIALFLFAGCTLGYKDDGKEVTWHSWNEGWGHTSFKVDADPKTFKALRGSYGRDSEHVFFMGGIIEGADPLSFWLVNLNDGNGWIVEHNCCIQLKDLGIKVECH